MVLLLGAGSIYNLNYFSRLLMHPKVLLIDNHDSFTYNLVQLLRESNLCDFSVSFPENIETDRLVHTDKILISPGPGMPSERPFLKQLFLEPLVHKCILGICLGHQAIVEAFGGSLINIDPVQHGIRKKVKVISANEILFNGISREFTAGLYHSWAANPAQMPECLTVTAISEDGVIMGVSHKTLDIKGLQFHPESYITTTGKRIIHNWLKAPYFTP